jgi:hypothetical protein
VSDKKLYTVPCYVVPSWKNSTEVNEKGLYLFKHKKDLAGNSYLIYIDSINGSWFYNINQHAPYLANKVVCKGNE